MRGTASRALSLVVGRVYSIGIYEGASPLTLSPAAGAANPAITYRDVSDAVATTVADPFMFRVDGAWHMFFEVVTWRGGSRRGEIALATSRDGLRWLYQRIVLTEPFHLSYPYVFEWGSEQFMVPESRRAGAVRLYRAVTFPTRWQHVKDLLTGPVFADSSVFHRDGRWWMLTETDPMRRHDTLRLFHARDLLGPWSEHPLSPVVRGNPDCARPGGRVLCLGDRVIRFAQSCGESYGAALRAFEITELSPTAYREAELEPSPVLAGSGQGWNRSGMHHLDAHPDGRGRWIACVDGWQQTKGPQRALVEWARARNQKPRPAVAREPAIRVCERQVEPRPTAEAARRRPLRVTHVITGLGAGGAETALYRLVSATRGDLLHSVISLTDGGHFGPRLLADGVPVSCLSMRPGVPNPLALVRLTRQLRAQRPDIIQSWMYHANLVAGLAAGAAGGIPVVWGIRHADLSTRSAKRTTRWTNDLCAHLSGALPARIVCCAESARRAHAAMGYRASRIVVIPNGFAADALAPEPGVGARVRAELAIPERAPVVGLVSRFHPDKDPDNFLLAARLVAEVDGRAVFLLVGSGLEWGNPVLSERVVELGLRDRVRLLGRRSDVPALLSAMDIFALPSRSEAFPNALAEAMLCGVPCVATDCGDSKEIVGSSGRIVPPEDSSALGKAILELLSLGERERAELVSAARQRIRETYDLREVARRYVALYEELCGSPSAAGAAQRRSSVVGELQCG